ncbi:hypothetical protein DFH94DRAFT_686153 [Russula ochroleuca]|uniref:Uncharacterized protein n=1 Tax=Russula ochroleuca TaxID=152965 RepID=A0A9P5MNT7_9AGAM|nr:hypothetical protein DFH94DRAFT_686153 [Russula ochroleuca]
MSRNPLDHTGDGQQPMLMDAVLGTPTMSDDLPGLPHVTIPSLSSSPSPPSICAILDDVSPVSSWNLETQDGKTIVATSAKATWNKFTANDIKQLMAAVCEVNPFMARWREKGAMWKGVAALVKKNGACLLHSEASIKNKVNSLLAYQQNPDAAGSAQIRVELGQDGGTVITALLEKALHLRDTANKVAEEQKEKTRTKQDEDNAGREAIRQVSDSENRDPDKPTSSMQPPLKRMKAHLSLSSMQAELTEMCTVIAESTASQRMYQELQIKYQEDMVKTLKASSDAYAESQKAFVDILQEKL